MNKKQIEKFARVLTDAVCVKHDKPTLDETHTLQDLAKDGYAIQRHKEHGFDGLRVTGGSDDYFLAISANALKPRNGKAKIVRYEWDDVVKYESADDALARNDVKLAESFMESIGAKSLRNIIAEGIEHVGNEVLPYEDPFEQKSAAQMLAESTPYFVEEKPKAAKAISLKGKRVCITGACPGMTREAAFTRLSEVGGIPSTSFTKSTDVLVVNGTRRTTKLVAAEKAIADGRAVEIIDGYEFVESLKAKSAPPAPKGAAEPKMEKATKEKETKVKKATKKTTVKKEQKKAPKKAEETAVEITLESMTTWCFERGLRVEQRGKDPMNPIWVYGVKRKDEEFRKELKDMGFLFGHSKHGKGWWAKPTA